jgi:hypothetical protein
MTERLLDTGVAVARSDGSGGVAMLKGDGDDWVSGSSNNVGIFPLDGRELVRALRAATTACLTVDQRVAYLDESLDKARAAVTRHPAKLGGEHGR